LNLPKVAGINVGTRDYYGVAVAQGAGFDIGASEAPRAVVVEDVGWTQPGFHLDAMGTINKTNVIEASTDMVHWVALTNTTSGTVQLTDTNSSHMPMRFYRVKQ
jgi:hypothetical protein